MTIKKSLILSHIVVCILPVIMTLFVMLSCFTGLYLYAKSGNHIMAESSFQFNVASNLIKNCIFHSLRHGHTAEEYQWMIEMIDPMETYVVLYQGEQPIYRYGNEKFQEEVHELRTKKVQQELDESTSKDSTYSRTHLDRYQFLTKANIHGETYHLYMMVHQPGPGHSDEAFEKALRNTNRFIAISLVLFVLANSYFLSRFIVRKIISPLKQLQEGAEKIQNGDLDVHLVHQGHDEFTPSLQAFNMMSQKLKESLLQRKADEEQRKELIASISHDIRTPLTSIKAYVEGLLDHVANTPEKQERYLKVIQKKADGLERLVEQLLLLTKMDVGEKALPMKSISLSQLAEEFIDENRLNWTKRGAAFTLDIEKDISISGSSLLLERIIENVVTNSIKYKTESMVHIHISLHKEGNRAVLQIADDGPGVPEESLQRLQEPFYRTDKARTKTDNGSGLGLAIVRRATALMQGKMEIQNVEPHGLMARIEVPMVLKETEREGTRSNKPLSKGSV